VEVGLRTRPEPSAQPRRNGLLPLVIGVGVAVLLALGLLVLLLLRNRDSVDRARALALDAGVAVTPSAAPGPLVLSPELPNTGGPTAAGSAPHVSLDGKPPGPSAGTVAPAQSPPSPAVAVRAPSVQAPASPAARGARCYSDPFTGQLRVAGAGHGQDSFPCRQNPFTGAYQRQ